MIVYWHELKCNDPENDPFWYECLLNKNVFRAALYWLMNIKCLLKYKGMDKKRMKEIAYLQIS
jgi:hypothetical protein